MWYTFTPVLKGTVIKMFKKQKRKTNQELPCCTFHGIHIVSIEKSILKCEWKFVDNSSVSIIGEQM